MATKSVNLPISIEQIIDLILQLPKKEQEDLIQRISNQKGKTENRYAELSEKINGFRFLETNWDAYNADKISDNSIQKAISILEKIISCVQNNSVTVDSILNSDKETDNSVTIDSVLDSNQETDNKVTLSTQNHSIQLHVFPMRNGGIQFELDSEDNSFEIEIDTKGGLKLIRFDEEGDILEEIMNFEINKLDSFLN